MDAVVTLEGNRFQATTALANVMPRLHADCQETTVPVQTRLLIDGAKLNLEWGKTLEHIVTFSTQPEKKELQTLAERLSLASESTDPELLIRRNQRISADLNRAREEAAKETAKLENILEKKKQELQASIHLAETDSLTNLYNRGAFDTRLREIFLRSQRQGEPMCLIVLDLDNFKQVNDTHGHQYGDEYLKRMANAMRTAAREHVDYSCRMGGDEFAIIVCAEQVHAQRIAQNILEDMEKNVSMGIAEMQDDDTIESLVGRADKALYEVKRNGRGHIALADGNNKADKETVSSNRVAHNEVIG
jgi:diguanylate cyclase (GGDEF)-like protein